MYGVWYTRRLQYSWNAWWGWGKCVTLRRRLKRLRLNNDNTQSNINMSRKNFSTEHEALMSSPLFQLSLASKELFHSNFLYWLAVNHPEFFSEVFKNMLKGVDLGLNKENTARVHREAKHFDFSVTAKDGFPSLILENKVKSIPSLPQLQKYEEEAKKDKDFRGSILCLLSLATVFPEKDKIGERWAICSYKDLAEGIDKALRTMGMDNEYHKAVIEDYMGYALQLHKTAESWVVTAENTLIMKDEDAAALRLNDLREKVRFSGMLALLNEGISSRFAGMELLTGSTVTVLKEKSAPTGCILTNTTYTKGNGLLDVKVKMANNHAVGIQIQDGKYRRCIECLMPHTDLIALAKDRYGDYFNDDYAEGPAYDPDITLEKERAYMNMSRFPACKFTNDFIYQYRNIKKEATIGEVIGLMLRDIEWIVGKVAVK